MLIVPDQARDTLTKKAINVASSREKEKSKATKESDFRKSQASPILKERLIEEKEKLSMSLKEAN